MVGEIVLPVSKELQLAVCVAKLHVYLLSVN